MTEKLQPSGLSAILCADWGKEAGKRAVFVADISARVVKRVSRRDWSVDTVLAEAERWKSRGTVLVTFDAPLGVPASLPRSRCTKLARDIQACAPSTECGVLTTASNMLFADGRDGPRFISHSNLPSPAFKATNCPSTLRWFPVSTDASMRLFDR